jgi:hypothetical protein
VRTCRHHGPGRSKCVGREDRRREEIKEEGERIEGGEERKEEEEKKMFLPLDHPTYAPIP